MAEGSGGLNRFYVVLGALAVLLGATLFVLLRSGGGSTVAAAAPPHAVVDDGFRGYTLGEGHAPVEIVEYVDYECPICAQFATIQMPTIRQQLIETAKVRWRVRDYPLSIHQYSRYAAHATQCGGEQGKFWELQDQLFYNHAWAQTGRNPARLFHDLAKAAGLNVDQYDACMASGKYASRIEFSRQEGDSLLVDGTPTFFLGGKKLVFRRLPTSDDFKHLADSVIAHMPPSPRPPAAKTAQPHERH